MNIIDVKHVLLDTLDTNSLDYQNILSHTKLDKKQN